jgi:Transposase DDE domain group 1
LNFERFTDWRLFATPGTVKLYESPGKAGGLPFHLLIGQIAINLLAWFKRLVLPPAYQQATIKTIRHHLLNLAGKLVHTARQCFLMLSDRYRYQAVWRFAIGRLAHLQFG